MTKKRHDGARQLASEARLEVCLASVLGTIFEAGQQGLDWHPRTEIAHQQHAAEACSSTLGNKKWGRPFSGRRLGWL